MIRMFGLVLVVAAFLTPLGTAQAAKPKAAKPSAAAAKPRTLDEVHIEGEVPVPQVLFITASQQRRTVDFEHRRFRRTALELGLATLLPSRVVMPSSIASERRPEPTK